MKAIFLSIVFVHGLIHSLGFIKAFGIREIQALDAPISKSIGFLWLSALGLFMLFGLGYLLNSKNNWWLGLLAALLSQILIFLYWKDAKFGTLPNILVLFAVLFSYSEASFSAFFENERKTILSSASTQHTNTLTEVDIESLPSPVKKWLINSGAVGKNKTYNGKITQKALMKLKPAQKNWYTATALQYTVTDQPAFIWKVQVKANPLMWFLGRDKFQGGRGSMMIKMNSVLRIVDEKGAKIDEGSLQRFLGEMVWFPSLAISPYISWKPIDRNSAEASMSFNGTKGRGRFFFNDKGEFVKFSALRFQGNEPNAGRKEWILNVNGYKTFEGIKVPSMLNATWKLDDGDWTWLEMEIIDIDYDVHE